MGRNGGRGQTRLAHWGNSIPPEKTIVDKSLVKQCKVISIARGKFGQAAYTDFANLESKESVRKPSSRVLALLLITDFIDTAAVDDLMRLR
jgi:hypothetical protein